MNRGFETAHPDWERQREQLSAYLDEALSDTERAELERHLSGCAECRRELAELREVRTLLRALPAPALERSFLLPETGAIPEALPLPSAPRQRTANDRRLRIARLSQTVGTVAAAAGFILLMCGGLTGILHIGGGGASGGSTLSGASSRPYAPHTSDQGGASSSQNDQATRSSSLQATGGGVKAPTNASPTPTGTAIPSPSPTQAPEARAYAIDNGLSAQTIVPIAGAGLLVGGAGLALGGRIARKRLSA